MGHKISNFSIYPRFPGVLDPDEKRRLSTENSKLVVYHKIYYLFLTFLDQDEKRGHATTRFLGKGGAKAPPLFFKGGAFLRKGGGQIFFVRPLPQKLILHHIDTFLMQVSWIGSKRFVPPRSHSFTGAFRDQN